MAKLPETLINYFANCNETFQGLDETSIKLEAYSVQTSKTLRGLLSEISETQVFLDDTCLRAESLRDVCSYRNGFVFFIHTPRKVRCCFFLKKIDAAILL